VRLIEEAEEPSWPVSPSHINGIGGPLVLRSTVDMLSWTVCAASVISDRESSPRSGYPFVAATPKPVRKAREGGEGEDARRDAVRPSYTHGIERQVEAVVAEVRRARRWRGGAALLVREKVRVIKATREKRRHGTMVSWLSLNGGENAANRLFKSQGHSKQKTN